MKPLLVGELNPLGVNPERALFPLPPNSAGWRLCHAVLGFAHRREYLAVFDRANLCVHRWSAVEARMQASVLLAKYAGGVVVALGVRVAAAFAFCDEGDPIPSFTQRRVRDCEVLHLPHPSGRCRVWNNAENIARARDMVAAATGVELSRVIGRSR